MKIGPIKNKKQYWKQIDQIVKSFVELPGSDSFFDAAHSYLWEKASQWEWFDDYETILNIMKYSESAESIDEFLSSWEGITDDLATIWVNRDEELPSFQGFMRTFAFILFVSDCHKEFDKMIGKKPEDDIDRDDKDIEDLNLEI